MALAGLGFPHFCRRILCDGNVGHRISFFGGAMMRIYVGSYERFLFGFDCPATLVSASSAAADAQQPGTLARKHTFAAHKVLQLSPLSAP